MKPSFMPMPISAMHERLHLSARHHPVTDFPTGHGSRRRFAHLFAGIFAHIRANPVESRVAIFKARR
jgi:hypothetical protein